MTEKLCIGVSKQSRVFKESQRLLNKAGYSFDSFGRTSRIDIPDENISLIAVKGLKQIELLLKERLIDGIFIGSDIATEAALRTDINIPSILDTKKAQCRLSPLAPRAQEEDNWNLNRYKRLLTKYPKLAEQWIASSNGNNEVREWTFGDEINIEEVESDADVLAATLPETMALDIVETGGTIQALGLEILSDQDIPNRFPLKPVSDAMKVSLQLFSREDLPGYLQTEVEELQSRLEMVLLAEEYVLIKYDIPKRNLSSALNITAERKVPTVNERGENAVVEVLVEKKQSAKIMSQLKSAGAYSIICQNINLATN